MSWLKHLKGVLVSTLVACLCIRVTWWALEPFVTQAVPYLIGGIVVISVLGVLWFRSTRI